MTDVTNNAAHDARASRFMAKVRKDKQSWCVFQCYAGCVVLAEEWFENHIMCSCYYPKTIEFRYPKRARTDAPTQIVRPAFGSYLFVAILANNQEHKIDQNPHIYQQMRTSAGTPWLFDSEYISLLMLAEANKQYDQEFLQGKDYERFLTKLWEGNNITIPYGPFRSHRKATLDCICNKTAYVKVSVLGKDKILGFPVEDAIPQVWRDTCNYDARKL